MAEYSNEITALEIVVEYEDADFNATHTDWYEWVRDFMETYLERLQAAIAADTTIDAYNNDVVLLASGDIGRYDVNAKLNNTLIVIHSPRHSYSHEFGNGRIDNVLECTVSCFARSAKGVDSNKREVSMHGDDTASKPGVLEMQADIYSLMFNNGALNLLASGGQDYLWNLNIGDIEEPTPDETKKSGILRADRKVTGHKWQYTWS